MFIILTITTDNWSFQKYKEDCTPWGDPDVYNNSDYRLDRNENADSYMIYDAKRTDGAFPPFAAYPRNITILKTTSS